MSLRDSKDGKFWINITFTYSDGSFLQLTKLGKVFAGIGLFFYLAAMTSQSMLLLALMGVIGGLFVVNVLSARKMLSGIELEAPTKTLIPEGGKVDHPWKVDNQGKTPAQMISVFANNEVLFSIHGLPPGDRSFHVPDLRLLKRGVYPHRKAQLTTTFPFGLLIASRRLYLEGETLVYPSLYPVETPTASGFESMTGGKFKGIRRSPFGSNFAGVRPWVAGDPVKQVHWKSSAKGKGLMVKTFEEELSGKVSVIIAMDRNASPEQIDNCLRAAGSLMFAALDGGHQLEWLILGEREIRKVPPFSDGSDLLEALARISVKPAEKGVPLEESENGLSRRSSFALVATHAGDEWLNWLNDQQMEGRKVSCYLPETAVSDDLNGLEVHTYAAHEVSNKPIINSSRIPAAMP